MRVKLIRQGEEWFRRIVSEPYRTIFLYLVVGGWNTVFGIGLYALAYWLFGDKVNYLLLAIPVNIIAISNAFVCYKLVVFRTRGHWLREYLRCFLVYGGGILLSMALMWVGVRGVGLNPAVSNAIATILVVICSYCGHKYFSFASKLTDGPIS